MNRANPVELRKALQAAHELAKAGILFVPIPVVSQDDIDCLSPLLDKQFAKLEKATEETE